MSGDDDSVIGSGDEYLVGCFEDVGKRFGFGEGVGVVCSDGSDGTAFASCSGVDSCFAGEFEDVWDGWVWCE